MRPPILSSALPTPCAAPLSAGPAEDVTLDRPVEAFDWTVEAVSFDFVAASLAASVVDACLLETCCAIDRDCRSNNRVGTAADMEMILMPPG